MAFAFPWCCLVFLEGLCKELTSLGLIHYGVVGELLLLQPRFPSLKDFLDFECCERHGKYFMDLGLEVDAVNSSVV